MIQKLFLFFGLVCLTTLSSCGDSEAQKVKIVKNDNGNVYMIPFEGLDAFLKYQHKIDQRTDLQILKSLFFTHKNGNTFESTVSIEKNGEIAKAQLNKTINTKLQMEYTFYFLKGVLSMAKVQLTDPKKCSNYHIFFNASQSPIATYIQIINNEKSTENHDFHLCKPQPWLNRDIENGIKQLSDMQNQEGAYQLHFIGFSEAFNKEFIEFGNSNYSTNLTFIPQEKLVQQIKKTPQAYQKPTFFIQFEQITEASGFSYQLLTSLKVNA